MLAGSTRPWFPTPFSARDFEARCLGTAPQPGAGSAAVGVEVWSPSCLRARPQQVSVPRVGGGVQSGAAVGKKPGCPARNWERTQVSSAQHPLL